MRTTAPLPVFTYTVMTVLLFSGGCKADVGTPCTEVDPSNCTTGEVCVSSSCACDTSTHYQNGVNCLEKIQAGETGCTGIANACTAMSTCNGNQCICNNGYYDSGAVCSLRLNPGVTCDAAIANVCKDNSACSESSCKCNNGYYDSDGPSANNGICAALIALSGSCTSGLGVTQCQTTGADCAIDNKCRCLQGTFDSNGFGTADGSCVSISNLIATPLGSSNLGTTSVTIFWSAPATYSGQVSRYDVTWTGGGGGTRTGTTATSLQVTGLQSATTYNFYIKSIESGSWTADQEVTTTTPITVTTKSLLGDTCSVASCADLNADCSTKCVCKSGFYDNDGDTTNVGGTCTAK